MLDGGSSFCWGTGLRSRGLLVQTPVPTKHGRCPPSPWLHRPWTVEDILLSYKIGEAAWYSSIPFPQKHPGTSVKVVPDNKKGLGTSATFKSNWLEGSKARGLCSAACRGCKRIYSLLCTVWQKFLLHLSKNSMANYKSLVNCLIQLW